MSENTKDEPKPEIKNKNESNNNEQVIPSCTTNKLKTLKIRIKSVSNQKSNKRYIRFEKFDNTKLKYTKEVDISIQGGKYVNSDCCICLEQIKFEDRHYLHCGHCYHCDCIKEWVKQSDTCPLCKESIRCKKEFKSESEDSISDIFFIDNFSLNNGNNGNNRNNNINNQLVSSQNSWTALEFYYYLLMLLIVGTSLISKCIDLTVHSLFH